MAVEEDWTSRTERKTRDGNTAQRSFTCSGDGNITGWDEAYTSEEIPRFDTNVDNLPPATPWDPTLLLTDWRTRGLSNQNVRVFCFYSNKARRRDRANQVGSWRESLDVSLEETATASWLKLTDTQKPELGSTLNSWATAWSGGGFGGTDENRPDLIIRTPRVAKRITVFSDKYKAQLITEKMGSVNITPFLAWYEIVRGAGEETQYVYTNTDIQSDFTDIGQWQFVSCHVEQQAENLYRYDLGFEYNKDGWNTAFGLVTLNSYPSIDFAEELFKDLLKEDMDSAQEPGTQ